MSREPNANHPLNVRARHLGQERVVLAPLYDHGSLSRDDLYRHAGYPVYFGPTVDRLLASGRMVIVEVQHWSGDIRAEYALGGSQG